MPRKYKRYNGRPEWWSKLLARAALEAYEDPTPERLQIVRALSQAATSADKHMDQEAYERRIDGLVERLALIEGNKG